MSSRRILFYSHDTYGLGHLRRTLKLAETLLADSFTTCLVVTGSAYPQFLRARPGLDFVKLPSVIKAGPETYPPRTLRVSREAIVELRSRLIRTSVEAFAPHVIIVDNVPRGMSGELLETLAAVSSGAVRCRVVLTMRDVLDTARTIRSLWREQDVYRLLETVYDEILVFGSPALYDVRLEYRFPPEAAARTSFCGHIGVDRPAPPSRPTKLLFTVGGGGDGAPLARQFLEACRTVPEELRSPTLMVLGPDMPAPEAEELRHTAREIAGLTVEELVPDFLSRLASASGVVCMGGYNTLCEAVALGRRVLAVPRCCPRQEQVIRARLFQQMGLLDVLHPHQVTPNLLAERLRRLLLSPAPPAPVGVLSFDGLKWAERRIAAHAEDMERHRSGVSYA